MGLSIKCHYGGKSCELVLQGMGDITARIGRMEEAHGLLAGKVEELLISGETKETTGAKAFSPVPIAQRSRENSKADYASPRKFRGRKSYLVPTCPGPSLEGPDPSSEGPNRWHLQRGCDTSECV